MTAEDRVKAVVEFGFTERQARFLVTVMLHYRINTVTSHLSSALRFA